MAYIKLYGRFVSLITLYYNTKPEDKTILRLKK
jgi:hypothetical protein